VAEEPKAEFQGFRLRRTVRDKDREGPREKAPTADSKFDFGVKLKVRVSSLWFPGHALITLL